MLKEVFLIAALSLPLANFQDPGGHNRPDTAEAFISEYKWLKELLEKQYPGNEFLIIPVRNEHTPPGWTWVPFGWRGHLIYRKPMRQSA